MQVRAGTYLGDGNNPRTVSWSGLSLTPLLVLVKGGGAGSTNVVIGRGSGMSSAFAFSSGLVTGNILSLGTDQFSVDANQNVNTAGILYYYVAFYDDGAGDFSVVTYVGTGGVGHVISGVGFTPDLVIVERTDATASQAVWKSSSVPGTNSARFAGGADITTGITALGSGSFTVGNSAAVNANTATYIALCFKVAAGVFAVGSYVGDASDDRDISVGFLPDFVFGKGNNAATAGVLRTADMADGLSGSFLANTLAAVNIKRFFSTVFRIGVGSSANASGVNQYWAAFSAGRSVPRAMSDYRRRRIG